MKKKTTKLAFSTETIRTITAPLTDVQLKEVVGGSLPTKIIGGCANSTLCTG